MAPNRKNEMGPGEGELFPLCGLCMAVLPLIGSLSCLSFDLLHDGIKGLVHIVGVGLGLYLWPGHSRDGHFGKMAVGINPADPVYTHILIEETFQLLSPFLNVLVKGGGMFDVFESDLNAHIISFVECLFMLSH